MGAIPLAGATRAIRAHARAALAALAVLLAPALGGCQELKDLGSPAAPADMSQLAPAGATLYTQFSLQYEKDRFPTTNYRRGLLLPINTEVTLVSADSKRITVAVKSSGQQLVVENVPKHTNETVEQAFKKLFAKQPVDLDDFSDAEQKAIRNGRAEVGMSKQAVLAAIGYPPAVGTATLEVDTWKYWDSRFTTFLVRFDEDGRVVAVGQ